MVDDFTGRPSTSAESQPDGGTHLTGGVNKRTGTFFGVDSFTFIKGEMAALGADMTAA